MTAFASDRVITVSFPPESKASGIADTGYHPVVWYRRDLIMAEFGRAGKGLQGERMLLHFGAVDYRTDVWLDGQHLGDHIGGRTRSASTSPNVWAPPLEPCPWWCEPRTTRYAPAEPDTAWGYITGSDADNFEHLLRELFTGLQSSPALAGFCYTQLTDTQQETNGLAGTERRPKIDPARIRSIVLGESVDTSAHRRPKQPVEQSHRGQRRTGST